MVDAHNMWQIGGYINGARDDGYLLQQSIVGLILKKYQIIWVIMKKSGGWHPRVLDIVLSKVVVF